MCNGSEVYDVIYFRMTVNSNLVCVSVRKDAWEYVGKQGLSKPGFWIHLGC